MVVNIATLQLQVEVTRDNLSATVCRTYASKASLQSIFGALLLVLRFPVAAAVFYVFLSQLMHAHDVYIASADQLALYTLNGNACSNSEF